MELRQSQELQHQLKLTQEMRTSIQLLAFSSPELLDYIQSEAENNPVVDSDQIICDLSRQNEDIHAYSGQAQADRDDLQKKKDFEMNCITNKISLFEYLEEQLDQLKLPRSVNETALWIINSLNKDGYFMDEGFMPLPFHPHYEAGLKAVQSLSPAGIGARSIGESLLIQAEREGLLDDTLKRLITEDLEALADRRFAELNRKYQINDSPDYLALIQQLSPRPAQGVPDYEAPQYLTVDVFFEKDEAGRVIPKLNDRYALTLQVNPVYSSLIEDLDEETKGTYVNYMNRISYLNQSITKRNDTLLKVSKAIISKQADFFSGESQYLSALTLNEIAEDIGNHVSTVSRAVRDKYISYNWKIIPLKSFFSNALPTGNDSSDEAVSKDQVLDLIKAIIRDEDKAKPLSDDKISKELTKHSVDISRRTVAKYRDQLNIPTMSKRKLKL